jgi:hypothetical protein
MGVREKGDEEWDMSICRWLVKDLMQGWKDARGKGQILTICGVRVSIFLTIWVGGLGPKKSRIAVHRHRNNGSQVHGNVITAR